MCCDILMILLYICVTWSWRIYDCSIYVLYKPGVTHAAMSIWDAEDQEPISGMSLEGVGV
jgi:hypothetical protein